VVKLKTFSQEWPHVVEMRGEVLFDDVMEWAYQRAEALNCDTRDIYTSFSLGTYGFKDKALAMEFKLRFG
jgi:hypothetical protein